jgi:hypothetical protein
MLKQIYHINSNKFGTYCNKYYICVNFKQLIMKKVYYFLFFALISQTVSAQIEGTWKLAPRAGSLAVGPSATDFAWWSSNEQAVIDRACLFDDSIKFNASGVVTHYINPETWIEEWQGAFNPQCGSAVPPHDGWGYPGQDPFTYEFNSTTGLLTMIGYGAHLGLAKVINGPELVSSIDAPENVTYNVSFSNNNYTMTAIIQFETRGEDGTPNGGVGYWKFVYDRTDAPVIGNPNVTFSVDMSQYTGTIATGVFLNGSFNNWCGECTPMTNIGNNIWETTVSLPAGGIQYKFTIDGWNAQEEFTEVLPCIDNIADGFNNRYYDVTTDFSIPTVCFNSCEACLTNSINEVSLANKMYIVPNPANDKIEIISNFVPKNIQITSTSGAVVLNKYDLNSTKNTLNISNFAPGVYFVNVYTVDGIMIEKLIVN